MEVVFNFYKINNCMSVFKIVYDYSTLLSHNIVVFQVCGFAIVCEITAETLMVNSVYTVD